MKKRKLISTAVVGVLTAAQMAMPVMAAGGQVDVDLTTKNPVLRVEVPTKLEIAVDQFETAGAGSQIYSEAFTMKNKSTVAVKVKVTSTATLAVSGVTLVASPADVDAEGEAWLAVAAQTEAGKYGVEALGDLSDANANVTTVVTNSGTSSAVQDFYLEKGSSDVVYKILDVGTTAPTNGASYAAEYVTITAPGTAYTSDADLRGVLATKDVYVEAGDGTVTRLTSADKDTAVFNNANTYYEAGATVTTVAASTKYVYAESKDLATAGGEAAFRYVGKLSDVKTGGWSKNDIKKIVIAYDIEGASASVYDSVKADCTYGLYTAPAAASITSAKSVKAEAAKPVEFTVALGSGSKGAKGIASVTTDAIEGYNLFNKDGDVVFENGKLTFPAETIDYLLTDPEGLKLTFPLTFTVTFEMNDSNAKVITESITLTK